MADDSRHGSRRPPRASGLPGAPPAMGCNSQNSFCSRWLRAGHACPFAPLGLQFRAETCGPGMCDFPVRREAGTGNRIPGDFFAFFDLRSFSHWQGIVRKRPLLLLRCSVLGHARKKVPRRHEASGETGTPRQRPARTDAATERHRTCSYGRGARRKPERQPPPAQGYNSQSSFCPRWLRPGRGKRLGFIFRSYSRTNGRSKPGGSVSYVPWKPGSSCCGGWLRKRSS